MKKSKVWQWGGTLLLLTLLIGSVLWLTGKVQYGEMNATYYDGDTYTSAVVSPITVGKEVKQTLMMPNENLSDFAIKFATYQERKVCHVYVELRDSEDALVQKWVVDGENLEDNQFYTFVLDAKLEKVKGDVFNIVVTSDAKTEGEAITAWKSGSNAIKNSTLYLNDEEQEGDLIIRLSETKVVYITILYTLLVSFTGAFLLACMIFLKPWRKAAEKVRITVRTIAQSRRRLMKYAILLAILGIVGIVGEYAASRMNLFPLNTVGSFNEYRYLFFMASVLAFSSIVYFRSRLEKEPEKVFLMVLVWIGILYVLVMPAEKEISWDESIHFWRTVALSHATSAKANMAEYWLYQHSGIPLAFPYRINDVVILHNQVQHLYDQGLTATANVGALKQLYIIAYIPGAIMLWLGRTLHIPYAWTFQMGAGANMAVYIATVYYAMKHVSKRKMVIAVIGGMATSFFLAAVYSVDPWITGFTILSFAYFLEIMQTKRIVSDKELWIMNGSLALALMPKVVYFPLFLIFIMIPRNRFASDKQYRYFIASSLALMGTFAGMMVLSAVYVVPIFAVLFVGFNLFLKGFFKLSWNVRVISCIVLFLVLVACVLALLYFVIPSLLDAGDLRGGSKVNGPNQLKYILENPVVFGKMLIKFLRDYYISFEGSWGNNFTTFGYLGATNLNMVCFTLLIAVVLMDQKVDFQVRYKKTYKSYIAAVCLMIIVMISVVFYIDFTEVGFYTIIGCQPRYLIPLMMPFFTMIGNDKIVYKGKLNRYNGCVIAGIAAILLISVFKILILNYY